MFEIARQAGSAGLDCKMLLWFTKRHCYYHRLLCHSLVLTVILLVTIAPASRERNRRIAALPVYRLCSAEASGKTQQAGVQGSVHHWATSATVYMSCRAQWEHSQESAFFGY